LPIAEGFHVSHKDREVACGNTLTCRTTSHHEDDVRLPMSVLVTRRLRSRTRTAPATPTAPDRRGRASGCFASIPIRRRAVKNRGGPLKIVAAIEETAVIVRILTHLGLAARAPPRVPARELSLVHAA
jgi:hypothetical protein